MNSNVQGSKQIIGNVLPELHVLQEFLQFFVTQVELEQRFFLAYIRHSGELSLHAGGLGDGGDVGCDGLDGGLPAIINRGEWLKQEYTYEAIILCAYQHVVIQYYTTKNTSIFDCSDCRSNID